VLPDQQRGRGSSVTTAIRSSESGATTSRVIAYVQPELVAWDVIGYNGVPATRWRFTLEPSEGGTSLRQWIQVGPGTGGLSTIIAQEPHREDEIMSYRLQEIEREMSSALTKVKQRSETDKFRLSRLIS
jgi:hypothetical protein